MARERTKKPESGPDAETPDDTSQDERIARLRERFAELGGHMTRPDGAVMDPDLEEQFLENVVAVEEAGWTRPADHLKEGGLELTPVDQLDDDEELSAQLRDVIHAMALRNMYVSSTDHLSDRELYAELLESLYGETFMGPATPVRGFNFVIDLVGSGSEEDNYLYMKYYADAEYRQHWLEEWPDDEMPEKTKPPYDRDRFLPQPDWTPPDFDDEEEPPM